LNLIAVDESSNQDVREFMQSISDGIGNGTINQMTIGDAIKKPWCDFMTVNIKLCCSQELKNDVEWHCQDGVCPSTMKTLNEEFNFFRGLFPLKVFITGPPCSGKTHFATRLNEMYGVPHVKIGDIVDMGKNLNNDYGEIVLAKIEELKDEAQEAYEKSRKKKDPDFDRDNCHPRLPDEILYELVKIQLNSAGCMNKGFILEGFPRCEADARAVFMDKIPVGEGQEQ
jgi:adenylate kinase